MSLGVVTWEFLNMWLLVSGVCFGGPDFWERPVRASGLGYRLWFVGRAYVFGALMRVCMHDIHHDSVGGFGFSGRHLQVSSLGMSCFQVRYTSFEWYGSHMGDYPPTQPSPVEGCDLEYGLMNVVRPSTTLLQGCHQSIVPKRSGLHSKRRDIPCYIPMYLLFSHLIWACVDVHMHMCLYCQQSKTGSVEAQWFMEGPSLISCHTDPSLCID